MRKMKENLNQPIQESNEFLEVNDYSKYAKVLSLFNEKPLDIEQEEINKNDDLINKTKSFLDLINESNEILTKQKLTGVDPSIENIHDNCPVTEIDLLIIHENNQDDDSNLKKIEMEDD